MKKRILILMGVLGGLSLCSCKLQREDTFVLNTTKNDALLNSEEEQTEEILTAKVLRVDILEGREEYDTEDTLIEMILGMTHEEAQEHRTDGSCSYETNTWRCFAGQNDFSFGNNEFKKAGSYGIVDNNPNIEEVTDWQMRGSYPKDEIDTCTSKEAIAICTPYAEALGITGDIFCVNTYALTLDVLEGTNYGAPVEDFVYMGVKERIELYEREGITTYEEKWPIIARMMQTPKKEESPWEKKHEAIVVRYTWSLNGIPVDGQLVTTEMIYVPYYGEIVCASGSLPYEQKEVVEEVNLISKEKAMSVATKEEGKIEIHDVELVYRLEKEDEFSQLTEKIAYPTWRVNYIKGEKKNTIWVDAITGFVVRV